MGVIAVHISKLQKPSQLQYLVHTYIMSLCSDLALPFQVVIVLVDEGDSYRAKKKVQKVVDAIVET